MPLPHTLLEVATDLATDAAAKAAFAADPEGFLADRGLEDWTAEDLDTALEHVSDTLPPELGAQLGALEPDADPAEVFGLLADVEAEPGADELAFGEGMDPGGEPVTDDEDDADLGPTDVMVTEDLDEGGEAPEVTLEPSFDEVPDADADAADDGADLDFGTGADDLPDEVAE